MEWRRQKVAFKRLYTQEENEVSHSHLILQSNSCFPCFCIRTLSPDVFNEKQNQSGVDGTNFPALHAFCTCLLGLGIACHSTTYFFLGQQGQKVGFLHTALVSQPQKMPICSNRICQLRILLNENKWIKISRQCLKSHFLSLILLFNTILLMTVSKWIMDTVPYIERDDFNLRILRELCTDEHLS